MNTYVFTREELNPICGHCIAVTCGGRHVAQLNLFDRNQRGFTITKLEKWLGASGTRALVAFGESVTLESEEPLTF